MRVRLDDRFYRQSALEVAPGLLGATLCRRMDDGDIERTVITEVEVYYGESDTACHAHRGKTNRTEVLYRAGGIAYVYLCYGIHHLLNVVTGEEGHPEAVLIRGVHLASGPGRLTKRLKIDRSLNGEDLCTSEALWIEERNPHLHVQYTSTPRIGIGYASKEDQARLWRYVWIPDSLSNDE